jgi:hypothetical protein
MIGSYLVGGAGNQKPSRGPLSLLDRFACFFEPIPPGMDYTIPIHPQEGAQLSLVQGNWIVPLISRASPKPRSLINLPGHKTGEWRAAAPEAVAGSALGVFWPWLGASYGLPVSRRQGTIGHTGIPYSYSM